MSHHIRLYNARGVEDNHPPLGLVGTLDNYTYGEEYTGRLDIVNPVGKCVARLVEGNLPVGYQIFVDNFNDQVVIKLPRMVLSETRTGLPNGNFEDGDGGWETKTGWAIETVPYEGNATNRAMVYRGGGSSKLRSDRFPIRGESLSRFSALWNQGPSNKKNVDLYTNLVVTDEAGTKVAYFQGNKIHDESNKSWHTSSGEGRPPLRDDLYAAIELEVFRRNSRAREVFVDNVEWNLTWQSSIPQDDYYLTVEVKDSLGRTASWTGYLSRTFSYAASPLYPVGVYDSFYTANVVEVAVREQAYADGDTVDTLVATNSVDLAIRASIIDLAVTEAFNSSNAMSLSIRSAITALEVGDSMTTSHSLNVYLASVLSDQTVRGGFSSSNTIEITIR